MSIINKIRNAFGDKSKVVSGDLKRLNQLQAGLGNDAIEYVLNGTNETVLSTVSTLQEIKKQLEICEHWTDKKVTDARRNFLSKHDPFDVPLVTRYAQLLAAACPTLDPEYTAGSAKTSNLIRVFFTEALSGFKEDHLRHYRRDKQIQKPLKTGLTPDNALEVITALGGGPVDFFDVVYHQKNDWCYTHVDIYRELVELRTLAVTHAQSVVEAGKRIAAYGRSVLVRQLAEWELVAEPCFLELALDFAGDSSKNVRESALSALKAVTADVIEPLAILRLSKGVVNVRAGMVELLSTLKTDNALTALKDHLSIEKTARVISAIENVLSVEQAVSSEQISGDDDSGYVAIDGSRVEIPPLKSFEAGEQAVFGKDDQTELIKLINDENQRIRENNEESKRQGYNYKESLLKSGLAAQAIDLLNKPDNFVKNFKHSGVKAFLNTGAGEKWLESALKRMRLDHAIKLSLASTNGSSGALGSYAHGAFETFVQGYINGPDGDLRQLARLDVILKLKTEPGYYSNAKPRLLEQGDLFRALIPDEYYYDPQHPDDFPHEALWPYVASQFDVLDQALGLKSQSDEKVSRTGAIRFMTVLPKPPMRYFGPLLEAATGVTKAGRAEARQILADVPEVEQRLVSLLDDSRQAVRAGAAEWLADRKDPSAAKALGKRLKKEKSELARAAILSALNRLGEDLSDYLGLAALLKEAEQGLKKAKFDKLDWLKLDYLPAAQFRDGSSVPADVLRWWIFLAVKLKQPGGNKLFDIYLDQLKPEDAEKFSTWILDSWINYDTERPPDEEGNAHAKQHAARHYKYMKKWYEHYTEEKAFAELKRDFMSQYLNSGAASKGLLALAKCASPSVAADRVRAYLKNHGSRTSQASSLLEVLAAAGDPVSLQVVIAAATRLRQKGVQKFAGQLVQKVAEEKQWSLDELADRTIPVAGLDDDGLLQLPCGEDEKCYQAYLDGELKLILRNPDGKLVKALPTGQDDTTKASKKQLSASRKELKQVVSMQTARLYEALCAERSWSVEDWLRDFRSHPVMLKLTERAVWLALNEQAEVQVIFRPTAEGDYTDAEDAPVELATYSTIRLAHGALMSEAQNREWQQHLEDYEVIALFPQFGRELLRIEAGAADATLINDRKGWVSDTFTIRGHAAKLGYERGEAMDGGYFNEYRKSFSSAAIASVIEFSGNCLPEENVPAAIISLSFEKLSAKGGRNRTITLSEVPSVLLSECWNDYRAMAAKAAYDENWQKAMPWM